MPIGNALLSTVVWRGMVRQLDRASRIGNMTDSDKEALSDLP